MQVKPGQLSDLDAQYVKAEARKLEAAKQLARRQHQEAKERELQRYERRLLLVVALRVTLLTTSFPLRIAFAIVRRWWSSCRSRDRKWASRRLVGSTEERRWH